MFDLKDFIIRTVLIIGGSVCIGIATGSVLLGIGVGLVAFGVFLVQV
jgi:hypothetical protein